MHLAHFTPLLLVVAAACGGAEPPSARAGALDDGGSEPAIEDAGTDVALPPPAPIVTPGREEVPLAQLPFVVVANGYGPVEKNLSNGDADGGDGALIAIGGTTYEHGVGVHSRSEITLDLGAKYERFVSDVGIDDEVRAVATGGTMIFQVLVDGQKIFESPVVTRANGPLTINVPVLGAQKLTLIATDAGDGIDFDHGDWAGARLVVK